MSGVTPAGKGIEPLDCTVRLCAFAGNSATIEVIKSIRANMVKILVLFLEFRILFLSP